MTEVTLLVLAVVAILFVLLPWLVLRGKAQSSESAMAHREVARALYQQRLGEIEGEAGQEVSTELKDELGVNLLADVKQEQAESLQHEPFESGHGRWLIPALAVALPVLAAVVYLNLVDLRLDELRGAEVVLSLDEREDEEEIRQWQSRLAARVARAPDDSKSLYLLGHAALKLNQFSAAQEAFAATNKLLPEDVSVQVYWLQARFLASQGVMDQVSEKLAADVLQEVPNMPVVLEVLALDAVRRGEPEAAVRYLNRALSGARSSRQQSSFVTAISQLREQVDLPGVTVHVETQQTPPAGSVVFVIARPVGGGMPYAVVRYPSHVFPQEVRLDDLVTMNESVKLSEAPAFEVVVRVSRTGTAMAQAGDWQWLSEPITSIPAEPLQALVSPTST